MYDDILNVLKVFHLETVNYIIYYQNPMGHSIYVSMKHHLYTPYTCIYIANTGDIYNSGCEYIVI